MSPALVFTWKYWWWAEPHSITQMSSPQQMMPRHDTEKVNDVTEDLKLPKQTIKNKNNVYVKQGFFPKESECAGKAGGGLEVH